MLNVAKVQLQMCGLGQNRKQLAELSAALQQLLLPQQMGDAFDLTTAASFASMCRQGVKITLSPQLR